MLDKLVERVSGPFGLGLLILVALPGGRQAIRTGAKAVVKAGIDAADCFKELYDEVEQEREFYGNESGGKKTKSRAMVR